MDYCMEMRCKKSPGEKKKVFFVDMGENRWLSNGCEDMDGSEICRDCREAAAEIIRQRSRD